MSSVNNSNITAPTYNPSVDASSSTAGGVNPFDGSAGGAGSQQQLFQEIEQLLPEIMQVLNQLSSLDGSSGTDSSSGINDGTDPGDGSTDPGDGSAYPGYGSADAGDAPLSPATGQYGATDPGSGSTDPTTTDGSVSAGGGPDLNASASPQSFTLTSSYNNVMNLISANGTNPTDITNAINQFEAQAGPQLPNVQNAMNNIKASLADGTYSQQGSQGALEGAAQRDGLQGPSSPQIDGNAGMSNQNTGWYDSGSGSSNNSFKNGSVGSNTTILANEISGGASPSQIRANALALAKEAQNAGMINLANAAQNIAKSVDDGSYNATASGQALASATNSDNLNSGATPVSWNSN